MCSCCNCISKRQPKGFEKDLEKGILPKNLKDQFIGMNIKQEVRIKIQQMNIDIFSIQILLELIDYLL